MGFDIATKKYQVLSLGEKKGKYSSAKILNFVRETKSYKEMRTMAGVNKQQMMHNICRDMSEHLVKPMLKEVVSMYAEHVTELSQEIKRLNNEISGSDESAPKNEAEERYNSDIIQLTEHGTIKSCNCHSRLMGSGIVVHRTGKQGKFVRKRCLQK